MAGHDVREITTIQVLFFFLLFIIHSSGNISLMCVIYRQSSICSANEVLTAISRMAGIGCDTPHPPSTLFGCDVHFLKQVNPSHRVYAWISTILNTGGATTVLDALQSCVPTSLTRLRICCGMSPPLFHWDPR